MPGCGFFADSNHWGVSTSLLLVVYIKHIRCIVEYASSVWSGSLTKIESNQIERVQKAAFAIILGSQYTNYNEALVTLESESLTERRKIINLRFAKKSARNPKFSHWFCSNQSFRVNKTTRSCQMKSLAPVQARTKTFSNSPIAYLTKLLIENK